MRERERKSTAAGIHKSLSYARSDKSEGQNNINHIEGDVLNGNGQRLERQVWNSILKRYRVERDVKFRCIHSEIRS